MTESLKVKGSHSDKGGEVQSLLPGRPAALALHCCGLRLAGLTWPVPGSQAGPCPGAGGAGRARSGGLRYRGFTFTVSPGPRSSLPTADIPRLIYRRGEWGSEKFQNLPSSRG